MRTKVFIDGPLNRFGPILREDRIQLIALPLAPEEDRVDESLIVPAFVLVVRLACDGIFGALVPLATAWLLLFVTKHALENQLIIDRELNRVILMDLLEACVPLDFRLDSSH